jgi:hypothetical protein
MVSGERQVWQVTYSLMYLWGEGGSESGEVGETVNSPSQDVLNLFRLEATFDDELGVSVHRTARSQFS